MGPGVQGQGSRVETTRNREHDSHLTQSIPRDEISKVAVHMHFNIGDLHDVEHHDTNDGEVNEQTSGTALSQSATRPDEETGTDRTT